LIHRDHVASEHHRLEVQPAAGGQEVRELGGEPSVDVVLPPGLVLLGRAEVLEGAEAGHGVEPAEGVGREAARVLEVDVEPVGAAGSRLRGGQGDAHSAGSSAPGEVEQRAPPATEVKDLPPGCDADLVGHVLVLAALGLLEAQREVAVVLAPLKSASSPRLSRKMRSIRE
jgi:hypothetical protein